jgi:hypothetical protein
LRDIRAWLPGTRKDLQPGAMGRIKPSTLRMAGQSDLHRSAALRVCEERLRRAGRRGPIGQGLVSQKRPKAPLNAPCAILSNDLTSILRPRWLACAPCEISSCSYWPIPFCRPSLWLPTRPCLPLHRASPPGFDLPRHATCCRSMAGFFFSGRFLPSRLGRPEVPRMQSHLLRSHHQLVPRNILIRSSDK